MLEGTLRFFRNLEEQDPILVGKKMVMKESITNKLILKQCEKKLRKASSFATISLQKKETTKSAMEHKYPDVQFNLAAFAGSLVVFDCRGRPLTRR